MKKLFILIILTLSMCNFATAQESAWLVRLKQQKWMNKVSSLKLLKTNRIETERILGEPDKYNFETVNFMKDYTLNNGRVNLTYTTKECSSIDGKISKDTIEDIYFSLEKSISFSHIISQLKIPIKQFKYSRNSDTPGGSYENEQSGVTFEVQYNRLHSIDFKIPERKNYSCVTIPTFLNDLDKVKRIKLLESNRNAVKKLFSEYKKTDSFSNPEYSETYNSGDASFTFSYSAGKCQFEGSNGYDTTEGNVESVKVSPINLIDPKELGIILAKYKNERIYKNISYLYVYYDKDLGISYRVSQGKIDEINFFPPQKYNSLMCDKEKAKILSSTQSIFTDKLKDRIYKGGVPAYVETLYISQNDIVINCSSAEADENKTCQDNIHTIKVFTRANNSDNDILTYNYTITGGKIIGTGAKVLWDLSDVKPGAYTITAAVDDGCGFCGRTVTKTVTVKECPDCKVK